MTTFIGYFAIKGYSNLVLCLTRGREGGRRRNDLKCHIRRGMRGPKKMKKKCHILFEWPLTMS